MGLLSEKQALEILGERDFRNLSSEKQQTLLNMLPQMEQSVAITAIQRCPAIINTVLVHYQENLAFDKSILDSNDRSVAATHASLDTSQSILKNFSQRENLSSEEAIAVLNSITEIEKIRREVTKDNQNYGLELQKNKDKSWKETIKTVGGIAMGVLTIAGIFFAGSDKDT